MRSPRTAAKSSLRSPQVKKAHVQQRRPNAAKLKKKKKKLMMASSDKGVDRNPINISFKQYAFQTLYI